MDNKELKCLFMGYGYEPRFVENLDDIDAHMSASVEWALRKIKKIQYAARSGHPVFKPQWPVLLLRTPKGWGGPKIVHGDIVEGSYRSHQVPLPAAKTEQGELEQLQEWLTATLSITDTGKSSPIPKPQCNPEYDLNSIRLRVKRLGARSTFYRAGAVSPVSCR